MLLGTKKGVFLAESDARREGWEVCGPLTSGTWAMYHVGFHAGSGERGAGAAAGSGTGSGATMYAGGASNWYGPAVWRSRDLGHSWSHSSEGLTYGDDGPEITQVWCVAGAHGALYAGVEPAGLFRSDDGGATWKHVAGLQEHPSRPAWRAASGGLCLHAIVPHPSDPQQLWVGISSGGVFRTRDGGRTWDRCATVATPAPPVVAPAVTGSVSGEAPAREARQGRPGTPPAALHPCVHALALAPRHPAGGPVAGRGASTTDAGDAGDGVRLYQQNHRGVYRSDDGGGTWVDVSQGLPSRYGFPLAVHPRDPETLYCVPLESDEPGRRRVPGGTMAVWRSRDGGGHWRPLTAGLPAERTSISVLRGALALDSLDPAGVYVGTATGQVYWSADEGDTWRVLPARLPPIYSVAAMPVSS
ncbi:MAG TPA: exo-alpha-sialidase [Chloroflexota bacterium]|nr:exo-alpha-sialidase [Chloroflexota bacterium]